MMNRVDQRQTRVARSDAQANRDRVLEAARQVFARRGLDAEMKEIAERAGVGIGTLYRHFKGREALLAALLQLTKKQMLRRFQAAVEADDATDALRGMIRAGTEVCEQFGALTEAMLAGQLDELHGGHAEFTELLASLLERGMREGTFRPDLDVSAAVVVLESIFTSGTLLKFAADRSYRGAAEAITTFVLRAIERPSRKIPADLT